MVGSSHYYPARCYVRLTDLLFLTMKLVLLVFSAFFLVVTGGQQEFLEQPENITVREGGEVRLDCVVSNKAGTLQWTRDDFGLGTSRELAGYSRLENILNLFLFFL